MSLRRKKLSGKEKVATLLVMLGLDDAANITQYMNQLDVRELAQIASKIKNVTKDELDKIAQEFIQVATDSGEVVSFDDNFSSEIIKRSMGEDHFYSLDFLQRSEKKQLIEITKNEHPQVIAFILSYIPSDRAGNVLAMLPPDKQADIAYRISNMEPPNPIALKHLDRMLSDKMNTISSAGSIEVGGLDSLVKIMRGVGRNAEKKILQKLDISNPELSEEIKARMFVFEDIILLGNRSIQKVLKDVNMGTLALALKKASKEITDLIMGNLSERARAVLMEDINSMGKIPLRDVEAAQQEVVEVIRRMEEAGEISIRKEEEVYV